MIWHDFNCQFYPSHSVGLVHHLEISLINEMSNNGIINEIRNNGLIYGIINGTIITSCDMVIYMLYALLTCVVPACLLGTYLFYIWYRILWPVIGPLPGPYGPMPGIIVLLVFCILLLLSVPSLYLLHGIIWCFKVNARIRVSLKLKLESTIICRIHGLV